MGKTKELFTADREADTETIPVEEQQEQEQPSEYVELLNRLRNKEEKLSYSSLKAFSKSPREFINYKLKPRTPPNEGQIFGSLCDCFLTQPDQFENDFTIVDKVPTSENQKGFCNDIIAGLSKEEAFNNHYKRGNAETTYETVKEYIEGHLSGKTICTTSQINEAKKIVENLKKSDLVMQYVNSCHTFQNKLEWEYAGWKFRGFTDSEGDGLIIDFKYAGKGSDPDKFEREIMNMKYYLQAAIYSQFYEGLPEFYFVVYDKSLNFSVIKVDYSLIDYGIREYKYLVAKLNQCIKENRFGESYNFFDHESSVRTIYKPKWVKGFDA